MIHKILGNKIAPCIFHITFHSLLIHYTHQKKINSSLIKVGKRNRLAITVSSKTDGIIMTFI